MRLRSFGADEKLSDRAGGEVALGQESQNREPGEKFPGAKEAAREGGLDNIGDRRPEGSGYLRGRPCSRSPLVLGPVLLVPAAETSPPR